MNNHRVRLVSLDDQWQAKCSCKSRSGFGTKPDARVWEWRHFQDVQRARTALAKTQSLRAERDYFLQQAGDYTNSPQHRDLWQQLADELNYRIGPPVDEDQLELW